MSSGSTHHAPSTRKPNAAASNALFKASSRFVNGQALGAGAGSKPSAMKRQRHGDGSGADMLSAESNSDQNNAKPSKKRFVGVRQRPSGRWVAEIKDTTQKIRLWLGTFDSAEEGAKAYDSAARALRGANTRTNFVPAMACEGASAPATKAARLIRLRQMAAAAKASCGEKSDSQGADHSIVKVVEPPEVIDSPAMVRPDLQQQSISSSSSSGLDPLVPTPASDHAAASPPKPPRLVDRRHNVLASPQPNSQPEADHDDGARLRFAAIHDHSTVDNGSPKVAVNPPKLEPQQSITSESLSDATARSSDSPHLSFPSPRSHFECMQPVNSFVEPSESLQHKERPAMESSFTVTPAPVYPLEAPRPSFLHHHPLSSCATNRDHVSMYPDGPKCAPEMDTDQSTSAFILREKEFAEMDQVPEIPWPEYTLESGMLPGLDESSGVYTSAFDFSAEAIDRDSCTSVMLDHQHVDHHDEFLALRMHYERTSSHEDHDQCVLLTQPLDSISSSQPHHVWRSMDVDGCWDGQSSGSTDELQIKPGGDCGECSSQDVGDHDVWSSMDLPPLCMVA